MWTPAVAELMQGDGIDMPVRTVGEYLERWGYTAKVPRRHAGGSVPEEVRHWLEVTYPAVEGGRPVRMRRSTGATRPAQRPTSKATGLRPRGAAGEDRGAHPHIRMNLISTNSNEGPVHFMTYKETMTAALFITFLERMLSETTRKIFLMVDRLRAP